VERSELLKSSGIANKALAPFEEFDIKEAFVPRPRYSSARFYFRVCGVGGRGFTPISKHTNQLHGNTVIVAGTGKKLLVLSVSISCARTPIIVQLPGAIPIDRSCLAATPLCQFNTTSEALLPGAVKRTSKNVCGVRLEPETLTE
jgi:hypothetical protein